MSSFEEMDDNLDNSTYNDNDDFDIWNIHSLINHISKNKLGFFLFLIVFLIIYSINSIIFSIHNSIPIPGIQNTLPMQLPQNMKRRHKKR